MSRISFTQLATGNAQVIYESATVNDFPETTVILKAGGTVTTDIFFF